LLIIGLLGLVLPFIPGIFRGLAMPLYLKISESRFEGYYRWLSKMQCQGVMTRHELWEVVLGFSNALEPKTTVRSWGIRDMMTVEFFI
jgi:hypothetical protein